MRAELFCFIYLSTGKRSVNPRHQNNAELLLTIHLDYHRLFKADMTQEFRFFHRRLGVEEILIVDSVIHKGIDRKIAYAERSEVLEEVSSLTRVYTIIGQSGLHYHTGGGDMRPLHRNAQPCVTAAPTSRTYKYIIPSCIEELQVHLLYFPGQWPDCSKHCIHPS